MGDSPMLPGKYVRVEAGEIRYFDAGDGPPLVLIHGLALHQPSQQWIPYFHQLSERFHVFAIDLPGWGMSYMPKSEYSFNAWVKALKGFCDALDLAVVDLMAYSFGAWIACLFAHENPGRVRRIASLHNPGLNQVISESHPAESYDLPSRDDVRARFVDEQLGDQVYEELQRPGMADAHVAVLNYIGDEVVRAKWSLRDRVPSMAMPILCADTDHGFVRGTVDMAALAPCTRLMITNTADFSVLVKAGLEFLVAGEIVPVGRIR